VKIKTGCSRTEKKSTIVVWFAMGLAGSNFTQKLNNNKIINKQKIQFNYVIKISIESIYYSQNKCSQFYKNKKKDYFYYY